ncbi:MAG: dTDP-4-dehydrorhamnose 3,5-epimerase, partial [Desulfovibrio sp.]|nr:dTDP-4-dehydrorhamnose 3,5-epimerase [Desulfovibrio sp.]
MGIDGVSFQPLKVIDTPGGPVLHMLRPDSPLRPHAETADGELHLGEVYFSEVLPGAIKAWKRHRRQTQY